MKSKLYLLLIISIPLLFVSCKKWLPENRVIGTWKLYEMQKRRLFDNQTLSTGYENGSFVFNENGSASYTDATDTLTGTWNMRQVRGGYYDSDNNWHQDGRTIFTIRLFNFTTNRVADWYFDCIDFRSSGNKLFAFIDGAGYSYRYDFRKQ